MNKIMLSVFVLVALTGCSNKGMVVSFDGISSQYDNDGTFSQYLSSYPMQTKLISVGGTLPIADIGVPCLSSGKRGGYALICMTTGKSKIVTYTYPSLADDSALVGITSDLDDLMKKKEAAVSAKLAQYQCESQAKAKQDEQNTPSHCDALKGVANSSRGELIEKRNDIIVKTTKENIFVYQWSNESGASTDAKAGSVAGFGGQASLSRSGYALVSGLKISQLLIGNDFDSIYPEMPKSTKIATTLLQAEKISYVSSMDFTAALAASLKMSPQQLAKFYSTLKETEQLEINALIGFAGSFSNQGNLGGMTKEVIDNWNGPLSSFSQSGSQYQSFYVVMSEVKKLRDKVKPYQKEPLQANAVAQQ